MIKRDRIAALALVAAWAALLAVFSLLLGPRRIFPDFIRPFFAFFLLAAAVWCLYASKTAVARAAALITSLAVTVFSGLVTLAFRFYKGQNRTLSFDDIYAYLQSDSAEITSFIAGHFLGAKSVLIACLVSALACLAFAVVIRAARMPLTGRRSRLFACAGLLCLGAAVGIASQTQPVRQLYMGYNQYYVDIAEFRAISEQLRADSIPGIAKKERGELYVIVIGESEGRDYVSAHQGPYPNAPWREALRKDDAWVVFENAYSNHTHTLPTLTAALGEGRTMTGLVFPAGQTILSISRQAGIKTHWLSNQAFLGPFDHFVSALAHQADTTTFTSIRQSYNTQGIEPDERLAPLLEKLLSEMNFSENNLVVIHLMGSHWQYGDRYPATQKTLRTSQGELGEQWADEETRERFEEHITSIQYTDQVLRRIFSTVAAHADRPTFFLYFADHGEDIFSIDGRHDIGNFTWPKARIPMQLWMSEAYRAAYPKRADNVRANASRIFSNDLLYDLYLGLAHIEVPGFDNRYDISGGNYSLDPETAEITGKRKIKNDPALSVRSNIAKDHAGQLTMHRANTVLKARQGEKSGIRQFEVDIMHMTDADGASALYIGHEAESLTGMTLHEYLGRLAEKPAFLWLDLKNLTEENSGAIGKALEELDAAYTLKDIVLLEGSSPPALAGLARAGWKTSYYLPWREMKASATTDDRSIFEATARQVREHGLHAVSYDIAADEAVVERLLPLLPKDIALYAWSTRRSFSEELLWEKIKKYSHIKKFLVSFDSPYHM